MNVTTIRTNLAAAAAVLVTPYDSTRPLRFFGVMPGGQITAPVFFLVIGSGPDHRRTAGAMADSGMSRVWLKGKLLLAKAGARGDLEDQQAELDHYRNNADAGSIWHALMLDPTVAGAAACVLVGSWAGLETVEHNGDEYIGDEIEIAVDAV